MLYSNPDLTRRALSGPVDLQSMCFHDAERPCTAAFHLMNSNFSPNARNILLILHCLNNIQQPVNPKITKCRPKGTQPYWLAVSVRRLTAHAPGHRRADRLAPGRPARRQRYRRRQTIRRARNNGKRIIFVIKYSSIRVILYALLQKSIPPNLQR